ncbi:isochorismatase family protein [Falsiroseomonas sp. HW251]|uniref:isochorismatase family protein n=1 Tax=Falsiroseomonas sp. HW251 TaxID=3390998 RepID=UPI003D312FFE
MPDGVFDEALIARVRARRGGRVHVTTRINPARTALVVIDMQRAFTKDGAPSGSGGTTSVIPAINAIAGALRAGGGQVAFSRATFDASEDGGWPGFYRRMVAPGLAQGILAALREGNELHALDPALHVAAGDFVFPKCRYSAFAPGASPLPGWLEARGIATVIVVGTLTNICCESTARDAMQWGYETIMVSDANAARDRAAHEATLRTFLEFFGDVLTTAQVLDLLAGGELRD